jgi:hypothetical protein
MWVRSVGLLLLVGGVALSYVGWRETSRIHEIEDQFEWEDAVYGPGAEVLGFGTIGACMILVGLLLLFRIL